MREKSLNPKKNENQGKWGTLASQWVCRSPHQKMSFAYTRKDVGSYPFRWGPTSQGSMNPGRAPRWSSAHCPRGVLAIK
jgi:hypothetical protein